MDSSLNNGNFIQMDSPMKSYGMAGTNIHPSEQLLELKHKNTAITKDSQQKNTIQSESKGRKHQPILFFIIHTLIACVISFQNIYIIYGVSDSYYTGLSLIVADLFFICFFSIVNSLYLVSFKQLVMLYTLFDNILVAEIAAEIGLVGSMMIIHTGQTSEVMLMIMVPISFFCFVGNFRVCIRHADWVKAQIIIYKLSILIGAVCFFEIGAYFMAVGYSYTNGASDDLDGKIKDFITLYAFGTFEFFLQLFGKICDFDQTADLKWDYEFKKQDEDEEDQASQRDDQFEYDQDDDDLNQDYNDQRNQERNSQG